MNDQVVVAPSGHLCLAVPLFRMHHQEELAKLDGYVVSLTSPKPLAYVLDAGPEAGDPKIFNADFIERYCEFLGDL